MASKPWRLIYQDVLRHPVFFDLPPWAFRLWIGMILLANDEGWIPADPVWLKRAILPTKAPQKGPKTSRIGSVCGRFEECLMVVSGRFDSIKGYQITNFARYQRLRKRTSDQNRSEQIRTSSSSTSSDSHDGAGQKTGDGGGGNGIPITAGETPEGRVVSRLMAEFGVGLRKAQDWGARFTEADLDVWAQWTPSRPCTNPAALRLFLMGKFQNPADVTRDNDQVKERKDEQDLERHRAMWRRAYGSEPNF